MRTDTLGHDLGWSAPAQFGVPPDVVVIVPANVEHEAGMRQRREQCLLEAFIARAAVEALDNQSAAQPTRSASTCAARCDATRPVTPATSALWPTRSVAAVIAGRRVRLAAQPDQPPQLPGHTHARRRRVYYQRRASASPHFALRVQSSTTHRMQKRRLQV